MSRKDILFFVDLDGEINILMLACRLLIEGSIKILRQSLRFKT